MAEWINDVPTDDTVELPPDPRAMEAIGRNHSLETALADLVDNSIDAGASDIVIRFVRAGRRLVSLYAIDNGKGIRPERIDSAMTVGGQRTYEAADLGRFGVGLKAASFSQARSLTVLTRATGCEAVGRRWRLRNLSDHFLCDVVSERFAASVLDSEPAIGVSGSGTIVRWDEVGGFPADDGGTAVSKFINHSINAIANHLGLVFHRLLVDQRFKIGIEVCDIESGLAASRTPVAPINPFGYLRPGRTDYPKDLVATSRDTKIVFRCHIWPGRSTLREFKLPGGAMDRQGMYFYRRGRLLHAGGWDGVHAPDRRLQLARVEVDIDDDVVGMFSMNPEKSRIFVGPEFAAVCESARAADGTSLRDYLAAAEHVFRASNIRSNKRKPMIYPGKGLPPLVRQAIEDEVEPVAGERPIDIKWRVFEDDDNFFDIDRENRTLWLNKRYRKVLLGNKHGGLNDLPLLKSLMYLLAENVFGGEYLGPRDKDNIEMWKSILTTAVRAERQ